MTIAKETVRDEREQYAFHDDIAYLRETKAGLTDRAGDLGDKRGTSLDAGVSPPRLQAL
jgi:hypothetical protein